MTQPQQIELKELGKPLIDQAEDLTSNHGKKTSTTGEEFSSEPDRPPRPSLKGPYRPLRNGTIQGSIFALLISAITTDCLNLPLRTHQLGIIPFLAILILTAVFSYYGMHLLQLIIFKSKVESYAEMVQRAFSSRGVIWMNALLVVYTWACCICFEVMFIRFTVQLLNDTLQWPLYDDRENQIVSGTGSIVRVIIGVLMIVFNWRYLSMTDLNDVLNSAGKFSVIGVFFCVAVVYLTTLFGFHREYKHQQIQFKPVTKMDYSNLEWFQPLSSYYIQVVLQGTASIYFVYLNHQYVFPLLNLLKRPSRHRAEQIFRLAHLEEFAVYGVLALLGYFSLSQHMDIFPISPLVLASIPTALILIAEIAITIAMFYRLPLQLFLAKEFIYQSLDIERNQSNLRKQNIILCGSSLIIALLFEQINTYFSLLGGTFGVAIGGIIPIACAIKLLRLGPRLKAILIFNGLFSVLSFLGAIFSVLIPI